MIHFSSNRADWETPLPLFQALDEEFHFQLDVAAEAHNAKCPRFLTPEENGLAQEWTGTCWCNPPYGREIGRWAEKALDSARNGATVVMLLPARPDTGWWARFVTGAAEVRFLRGRLRFVGGRHTAPFPSAIAVFRPGGAPAGGPRVHWSAAHSAADRDQSTVRRDHSTARTDHSTARTDHSTVPAVDAYQYEKGARNE